jgi:hypothetical protein
MDRTVQAFTAEARRYCTWAVRIEDGDQGAANALRRIVALYQAALRLPEASAEGTQGNPPAFASGEEREAVRVACARLPLQYYSELFDPLPVPATEEAVVGDIADDLADIFSDVLEGLRLFDRERVPDAVWRWAFGFQSHWGRHASCAIRTLHATWRKIAASG